MVIYSSLYIFRWIEALVLHIHVYRFFSRQPTSTNLTLAKYREHCKEGLSKKRKTQVLLVVVALCLLIHCLSIPILGIILEVKHGQEANCDGYVYEHHTVYWILDAVRYLHDVAIRLVIFLATVTVGAIWFTDSDDKGDSDNIEDEPNDRELYLRDKAAANQDHKCRMDAYTKRGTQVEHIHEIFQTWFVIPWISFLISSSLETDNILKGWKNGPSSSGQYDFPEVVYMVYHFNQVFLLALPYLCMQKMNAVHQKYLNQSRFEQLAKFKTASRVAHACRNRIEKEEHYDFVPRIWGTGIKIHLDSPLYIVLLLIGVFFTIVKAL